MDQVVLSAKKSIALEKAKKHQTKRENAGEEEEKKEQGVIDFNDLESMSGSSLEFECSEEEGGEKALEMVIEEPPSEEVYERELQKNMTLVEGDPSQKYLLLH